MQAAAVHNQPTNRVHLLGNIINFLATGSDTSGAYSLVEVTTAPGAGTPPHRQNDDEELFYVLEGTYEFLQGERRLTAGPGSHVMIQRGQAHAFRNAGSSNARMLIVNSPGGYHENFFLEAGKAIDASFKTPVDGLPDMPVLLAAAQRYGIEFLPQA